MDVMLINDTGVASHVGCMAVSDAHARLLGRAGHHVKHRCFLGSLNRFSGKIAREAIRSVLADHEFVSRIIEVDAVIANGEGTIHHGAGTDLLAVLGAAQTLGKPTLLVNAVIDQVFGYDDILDKLDDLTVRDMQSQRFLQQRDLKCRLVVDSCIEAKFNDLEHSNFYPDGTTLITDWHHERDADVGKACLQFMSKISTASFVPMHFADAISQWQNFVSMFARSQMVVTGRHHGIYLAALARKPFIPLGSNTHKIAGVLALSSAIPECAPQADSIEEYATRVVDMTAAYEGFFGFIAEQRPLNTFRVLGSRPVPDGEEREVTKLSSDLAANWNRARPDIEYMMRRRSSEMLLATRCSKLDS